MKKEIKIHFDSSVFPAILFGAVSGALAGAIVTLYKYCAKGAVAASSFWYGLLREYWYFIPVAVLFAFGIAFLLSDIYKKEPDLQGGGIPASIGTLRGLFSFHPAKTALGSFCLSLISFLFGVPLGTDTQELFNMLPYVVTIVVLVITSMRKKREHQPPAGLGLPYFREER